MTEMVYGTLPLRDGEPILPKWWRTIDRWSLTTVLILFGIGLLLGLAASPPLAERVGYPPFHFVTRQAVFGVLAMAAMVVTSVMSPQLVRRLAVMAFAVSFVALIGTAIYHTFNYDRDYYIPAEEVERIEAERTRKLANV